MNSNLEIDDNISAIAKTRWIKAIRRVLLQV